VDKVMPYCLPVLAERQHVAETAQRSHVRRKGAEAASRALGEVTAERLRARGVDPRGVEWDAWRREDGRWDVQASYLSGDSQRSALFVFDAAGRYSFPEDDEAKWITGEAQSSSRGPQPRDPGPAGERRLSAVRDDEDLLALSDAGESGDGEGGEGGAEGWHGGHDDDLTAVAKATEEPAQGSEADAEQEPEARPKPPRQRGSTQQPDKSRPAITSFLDQALNRHHRPPEEGADPESDRERDRDGDREGDGEGDGEPEPQPHGDGKRDGAPEVEHSPGRKRRGRRASVPSWDEIMFGKDDEPAGPPE
jgi:DUF3071 family protein